jgi:hypothetical protein
MSVHSLSSLGVDARTRRPWSNALQLRFAYAGRQHENRSTLPHPQPCPGMCHRHDAQPGARLVFSRPRPSLILHSTTIHINWDGLLKHRCLFEYIYAKTLPWVSLFKTLSMQYSYGGSLCQKQKGAMTRAPTTVYDWRSMPAPGESDGFAWSKAPANCDG